MLVGRCKGSKGGGLKGRRSDLTGRKGGAGVIIPCFVLSLRRGKSLTSIIVLEMFMIPTRRGRFCWIVSGCCVRNLRGGKLRFGWVVRFFVTKWLRCSLGWA